MFGIKRIEEELNRTKLELRLRIYQVEQRLEKLMELQEKCEESIHKFNFILNEINGNVSILKSKNDKEKKLKK